MYKTLLYIIGALFFVGYGQGYTVARVYVQTRLHLVDLRNPSYNETSVIGPVYNFKQSVAEVFGVCGAFTTSNVQRLRREHQGDSVEMTLLYDTDSVYYVRTCIDRALNSPAYRNLKNRTVILELNTTQEEPTKRSYVITGVSFIVEVENEPMYWNLNTKESQQIIVNIEKEMNANVRQELKAADIFLHAKVVAMYKVICQQLVATTAKPQKMHGLFDDSAHDHSSHTTEEKAHKVEVEVYTEIVTLSDIRNKSQLIQLRQTITKGIKKTTTQKTIGEFPVRELIVHPTLQAMTPNRKYYIYTLITVTLEGNFDYDYTRLTNTKSYRLLNNLNKLLKDGLFGNKSIIHELQIARVVYFQRDEDWHIQPVIELVLLADLQMDNVTHILNTNATKLYEVLKARQDGYELIKGGRRESISWTDGYIYRLDQTPERAYAFTGVIVYLDANYTSKWNDPSVKNKLQLALCKHMKSPHTAGVIGISVENDSVVVDVEIASLVIVQWYNRSDLSLQLTAMLEDLTKSAKLGGYPLHTNRSLDILNNTKLDLYTPQQATNTSKHSEDVFEFDDDPVNWHFLHGALNKGLVVGCLIIGVALIVGVVREIRTRKRKKKEAAAAAAAMENNGQDSPDHGDGFGPDHGDGSGPDHGGGSGPDHGDGSGPDHGDGSGPDHGDGSGPDQGDGSGPDHGDVSGPDQGGLHDQEGCMIPTDQAAVYGQDQQSYMIPTDQAAVCDPDKQGCATPPDISSPELFADYIDKTILGEERPIREELRIDNNI